MKRNNLFFKVFDVFNKIKDGVPTLKNFLQTRERNRLSRSLEKHISPIANEMMDNKIKELFQNNELGTRIWFEKLLSAINNNKFINQMEANSTRGYFDPDYRTRYSERIYGVPYSEVPEERFKLEKYGCLVPRNVGKSIERNDGARQYGDCCVTFNKTRMKGRTTYTLGDSLVEEDVAPNLVGEPFNANCFAHDYKIDYVRRSFDRIKNCQSVSEFNSALDISYTELQFHGDVTLDDVSSIRIPDKYMVDEDFKMAFETILIQKNIPVYTYDFMNDKEYQIKLNEFGELIKEETKL